MLTVALGDLNVKDKKEKITYASTKLARRDRTSYDRLVVVNEGQDRGPRPVQAGRQAG